MNTTLHHSTSTHPPDTEDQLVLQIPAPDELRELALSDRISLRVGLWLLERAQRPKPTRARTVTRVGPLFLDDQHFSPGETKALLEYHLLHQLR
ncbi:hypothetical protein [Streptomyces sp. AC495_CC817]|uniref:hypothetical protein n=1 Tax=Streptomyces sp. AC495_CC817 TaxID=2823900 RepID=UPI001C27D53B|nr:hypothetical protein [Streptomyces sp. AC495_CC817]